MGRGFPCAITRKCAQVEYKEEERTRLKDRQLELLRIRLFYPLWNWNLDPLTPRWRLESRDSHPPPNSSFPIPAALTLLVRTPK